MKVTVTRSGGFTGMVRQAEAETGLDPPLQRLIDQIDLDDLPAPTPAPDRFVYTIDVGGRTTQIGEEDL